MSPFSGARARIFVWMLACTCTVPMWGELQLGFRELSDWPLRDARRLLWLAPWRPPVKTILIEHRLSKHTDWQAPQWLVRQVHWQVQVGAWFGVLRTRGAAARTSDRVWGALAPASGTLQHIVHHIRISGYDILIYRYCVHFFFDISLVSSISW